MKSKYTLLVVLFMIVVLLVVDHFLFASSNSSPENKEKVTVTPTATSLSRLSNTENNIHLFLIFNNSKLQNPDVLVGNIQYLWGPSHNKPINPSIYTSAYVPSDWPASLHQIFSWWKTNHPDWIVYKCDKTTPAFIDPTETRAVPLDISNPAVLNFQMNEYVKPYIQNGNNSIGFDNVIVENYTGKCGVWRNGRWIQLYKGQYRDPVYANIVVSWAKAMYNHIKHYRASTGIAFNMNLITSPTSYQRLASYTDIILDEGGFTNFGKPGNNYITDQLWRSQIETIQQIIKQGKGFILNAYEPGASYLDITNQEVLWDLSNYLLLKGSHTFTYVSVNQNSPEWGIFFDQPEYHVAIGQPTSNIFISQGVYMRLYSNGLVIVNPSSTNSYYLNFKSPYHNMRGKTVTNYTIGVHSGLILLINRQSSSSVSSEICIALGSPIIFLLLLLRCIFATKQKGKVSFKQAHHMY